MFADDIALLREVNGKWGPVRQPVIEVGGLRRPTIADYTITIDAMARFKGLTFSSQSEAEEYIARAQWGRYQTIEDPVAKALGCETVVENPEDGGLLIEQLHRRYQRSIGTIVCLSTLEHVSDPYEAAGHMRDALQSNGLAIVSVPWQFPFHPSPRDLWRFSPDALREIFSADRGFELLYCDWRLRIPADAGVLDIQTGRPQTIESCACVARVMP